MKRLMQSAARINPARCWAAVSVVILDDAGIMPVNRLYLDADLATDVIAFAYPVSGARAKWQGELFVNVQRAAQIGRTPARTEHELALYLAHGADHLAGHDDHNPAARRAMRRRELDWLRRARADGLLRDLLLP